MKIAVTSQNRKTVTGHAGKCRKFWIYDVADCEVLDKHMLELPIEQTFHESHGSAAHPLEGVNVLITAGMGDGLQRRLKQMGIMGVATAETDPERAVTDWLNGTLKELPPGMAHTHEHSAAQGHGHVKGQTQYISIQRNKPPVALEPVT